MSDSEAGLINDDAVGVGYEPPPPAPTVTSIDPASAPPGTAFTLHVHGSGFTESAQVRVGGNRNVTTFVSDTELTVDVAAERTQGIDAGQRLDVWVDNAPGQTNTATFTFGDEAPGPSGPTLTALFPDTAVVGSTPFVMTILGSGFTPAVQVWANGAAVNTGYASAAEVETLVDPTINVPGVLNVWVTDVDGQSNTLPFTFTAAGE